MKNLINHPNRVIKSNKFLHRSHSTPSLKDIMQELNTYDDDWDREEININLDDFYDRRH